MKKIITIIFALLLLCGVFACAKNNVVEVEETPEPATLTPTAIATNIATTKPSETATPEPSPTPKGLITGKCGDLTWMVNPRTHTLTISGEGEIPSYKGKPAPWDKWGTDRYIGDSMGEGLFDRLVIEEGVTKIGKSAFSSKRFKQVSLPESLQMIEAYAFSEADIGTLFIPKNVKTIENGALQESLVYSVKVDPENKDFCVVNGVLFSKDMSRLMLYPIQKDRDTTSYTVPSKVKRIDNGAFFRNIFADSSIEILILPEGLTHIGDSTFGGCTELTDLKLPSTVRSIGTWAFSGITLDELIVPEGVTELPSYAFGNTFINRIIVPASLKKIGVLAFSVGYRGANVYFLGQPPVVVNDYPHDEEELIPKDGRDYFDRATLYYPRKYESAWAPNGEMEWSWYKIAPYDILPGS